MLNLTAAVEARLKADIPLAALLAQYQGDPAIFTSWPVPADAERPYVVTAGHVADVDNDADGISLRTIVRDVACYGDNRGSAKEIEEIAEAVRSALHGQIFTIDGGHLLVCRCAGPIVAPTDDRVIGRIVTASFLVN